MNIKNTILAATLSGLTMGVFAIERDKIGMRLQTETGHMLSVEGFKDADAQKNACEFYVIPIEPGIQMSQEMSLTGEDDVTYTVTLEKETGRPDGKGGYFFQRQNTPVTQIDPTCGDRR